MSEILYRYGEIATIQYSENERESDKYSLSVYTKLQCPITISNFENLLELKLAIDNIVKLKHNQK